jgi:hypothetical protein
MFWQSFFAMNFKAVKDPDNKPILPGLNLFWAIAVPLAFGTIVFPVIGAKVFQWIMGNSFRLLLTLLVDCIMLALYIWLAIAASRGSASLSSLSYVTFIIFHFFGIAQYHYLRHTW